MKLKLLLIYFCCCFYLPAYGADENQGDSAFSDLQLDSAYQPRFYAESNLEFTLLHELSHAIIDLNHIPVLGGQEKAADQIATMLMMLKRHGEEDDLLDQMISISAEWMIEWRQEIDQYPIVFWDVHPLSIQRFYDVTCLVYGAEADQLERIRKEAWLPIERAWSCDLEYQRSRETLRWLADNYSYVIFDDNWQPVPQLIPAPKQPRVRVEYVEPATPKQRVIWQWLQDSERIAGVIQRVNETIKLPTPVTIYFESQCSGPDAWWNPEIRGIIICYALIEQFEQHAERLKPLVNKLDEEANQSFLFRFPEKYAALISQQKTLLRERFIHLMDRMLEQGD